MLPSILPSFYRLGVDKINWFAPYADLYAPYAKLLRSFSVACKFGVGQERSTKGAKQFMKSTPWWYFIGFLYSKNFYSQEQAWFQLKEAASSTVKINFKM